VFTGNRGAKSPDCNLERSELVDLARVGRERRILGGGGVQHCGHPVRTMRLGRRRTADRERRRIDRRAGLGPERCTFGDSRRWICSRAVGSVLEVGVGTGLNMGHYPRQVELTAVDRSPQRLSVARSRADLVGSVLLLQADAGRLPFAAASFDSVVCTLAMCEFTDRSAVLTEMYRILRPGGRLLLLDHAQWRWPLRGRPVTLAVKVGFVPYRHERLRLGLIERLDARRPEADVPSINNPKPRV
jgi:SAM-dependent methyltransferase